MLNRYARCVDTKAWSDLGSVFVDGADCVYSLVGGERATFPEILEWLDRALDGMSTQHMLSNYEIQIDGDSARTSTYLQAQHTLTGTQPERHMTFGGRYEDEFVRTEAGWRIVHRTLHTMWMTGAE